MPTIQPPKPRPKPRLPPNIVRREDELPRTEPQTSRTPVVTLGEAVQIGFGLALGAVLFVATAAALCYLAWVVGRQIGAP